jgi:hypothetical protein
MLSMQMFARGFLIRDGSTRSIRHNEAVRHDPLVVAVRHGTRRT